MLNEQKLLDLIASEPLIRTKELMNRFECDIDEIDEALAPLLKAKRVLSQPVRSPSGQPATGYTIA